MDKPIRILLVEDNPDDAHFVQRELNRAGLHYELRKVERRNEYLAALDEFKPDLILSDHRLADFNGLVALTIAKERCPTVPFILVSGVLGEELAVESLKSGATDYVLKNRLFRLIPAINRALRDAEFARERQQTDQQIRSLAGAIESTSELIAISDPEQKLTFVNRAFLETYGYAQGDLLGQTSDFLVADANKGPRRKQILDAVLKSEWKGEQLHRTRSGREITVFLSASAIRGPDGKLQGFIEVARDITKWKEAEAKLRNSQARNRALLDAIPDYIFRVHRDGTVLDLKQPRGQGLVVAPRAWIGRPLQATPLNELAQQALHYVKQALESGEMQVADLQFRSGRELRDFEARVVASGPDEVLAIVRDITERKRLENEILEISAREHRSIGQDLHDGVGQLLTGVAFMVKALEGSLAEKPLPEAAQAAEIGTLVQRAISQTRKLSRGLLLVDLGAAGLGSALQELAAKISQMFNVQCCFEGDPTVLIPDQSVNIHLYRIAQEAASNAVKHGKARRIELRLRKHDRNVELAVLDDGVGISDVPGAQNLGLRIMRYRARTIGATFDIQRGKTGGTSVSCRLLVPALKIENGVGHGTEHIQGRGGQENQDSPGR